MVEMKWNPNDISTRLRLQEDGLTVVSESSSWGLVRAPKAINSGKWYWEYEIIDVQGSGKRATVGVVNKNHTVDNQVGYSADGRGYYSHTGRKYHGNNTEYGEHFLPGDIIGTALDMDNGTIEFFKNGISQGVAYDNLLSLGEVYPALSLCVSGASVKANFGKEAFCITEANGDAWRSLVLKGYRPYGAHESEHWFSRIKIKNLQFSERHFNHKETGEIVMSGTVYSSIDGSEQNEEVLLEVSAHEFYESRINTTPFDFNITILKESFKDGSNTLLIAINDVIGREFAFGYEINKEHRDTFKYKRFGIHDSSYKSSGDIVFRPDAGYLLKGFGDGEITIEVPSEGKSNIEKITIDGTPDVRKRISRTYDMDLVSKEELQTMVHFKTEVDLTKLTVVEKAELRR